MRALWAVACLSIADVYDYQVDFADGGVEGGETSKILQGGR